MQSLGISDSPPRTESRWRTIFWPTIRDDGDFDHITEHGFWVCFAVAVMTLLFSPFIGSFFLGLFESVFFFLAGVGVRQRSRVAGIAAFTAYLMGALVLQRYTGNGFGILRVIFLALLLANVRGSWISARWEKQSGSAEPAVRFNETFWDKLSDQLPAVLWPKSRFVFYVLAVVELSILSLSLLAPRQ